MKRGTIAFGLLAQLLMAGFLWAQADRGAITGTVTDPSGAVIPGVQVTATNVDTKVQTTTTTNEVGLYTVLNLPIGKYSVTFMKQGFKTYDRSGITVGIAQVVRLDASMQVGAVTESVTVTAEASVLRTETADVGTYMRSQVVTDLPLSISGGRSLENFAYAITPGVEGNNWTSWISGSAAFTKEVLIDGTSAIVQIGGHIGESSPSMEAVQEFKVETSGIRAEDGRTGGGVFKFTLKSGTNDFHGSAFGLLHNEMFNANTWDNNFWRSYKTAADPANKAQYDEQYRKPFDRQFVYGFSAGGPIIKNKTFIFGAFEKYMQERFVLGAFDKTVPIPDFLDGNFSALLDTSTQLGTDAGGNPVYAGAIFDPGTGLVFPGNIIPDIQISDVSRNIVDIYRASYQPMRPGLVNNSAIVRQNDPWFHQTQATFKADHNFSDKSRLSGHFNWIERPRILVDQGGIWNPTDADKRGGPLAKARFQKVTSRRFALNHTYSFTPSVLNVASFTYGRYRNPSLASAAGGDWPSQLGLGNTGAGNFPEIGFGSTVNGVSTSSIGYSSSGYYVSNVYIANEALTWMTGRHTLKFGGDIRWFQMNSHAGTPTLSFSFNNAQTGAPTAPYGSQVGFGFASFLLGAVESASQATPFDLYGRRKTISLFAQDDFKVSPKLTLTLDLRWDVARPFTEKYGHWANFDKQAMNPTLGIPGTLIFAKDGQDSFEKERDWKEFAPHVGVAYQLTPRAVLRGAYGIFFSPIGLNYWSGVPYGFAPGYQGTNAVPKKSDFSPAFYWDNGYPGVFVPGNKDPDQPLVWDVNVNPRSLFAGYMQQWNVGTEFELTKDTRLDITYLGSKGSRLQSGNLERNQPDAQAFSQLVKSGHEWDWVWDQASAAAAGVPYPHQGFSNFAFFALLPFPQVPAVYWGPLFSVGSPLGRSDYHSLQIALSRRTARGLAANVSYTLSRGRGNIQNLGDPYRDLGGFQETWWSGPIQDVNKLDEEAKTILFYDQKHIFKGYAAWDLPLGKGRRFLSNGNKILDAFVGGWTLSTSFRYNSGFPMTVPSSYYYWGWAGMDWNYGNSRIYTNVAPNATFKGMFNGSQFNPVDTGNASNLYFTPGQFSNPTWGEFGTGPLYLSNLRGFGYAGENVGLLKTFRFSERFRLQFRFELYNVFNRHYFSDPNTDIGNASQFGHVTSTAGSPREGQFGARFEW
jgi:hypothetical protein